jgi:hypothetical protein
MTALAVFATVIVLGLVGLIFWLKSPWISLLGWVSALSIQVEVLPDFRLALSDLFVPTLALTLLLGNMKTGEKTWQKRSSLSALILTFATVFIVLGTTVTYFELGTVPRWAWLNKDIGLLDLMICFFAITQIVDTREKMHTIVKTLVLSGSLLNILALLGGIARYFFGIPNLMMYADNTLRLAGFLVNPSAYGGFISCILLIQLALLFGELTLLPLPRWTQGLNVGLLGVGCLLTISRSALLGLLGGLLVLLAFYRLKAMVRLVSLALLTVLMIGAVTHWVEFSPEVADGFWDLAFNEATVDERTEINRVAIDMLFEKPTNMLTGTGVGTFLVRADHRLYEPTIIHNEFLWLLVETGVLGVCLFGAIVVRSLRNCVRVVRDRSADSVIAVGAACSIVGILVWMLATEGLWYRHVWLLLALTEVCYRLHMESKVAAMVSRVPRLRGEPKVAIADGTLRAG